MRQQDGLLHIFFLRKFGSDVVCVMRTQAEEVAAGY